jgi:hypothetical protein
MAPEIEMGLSKIRAIKRYGGNENDMLGIERLLHYLKVLPLAITLLRSQTTA